MGDGTNKLTNTGVIGTDVMGGSGDDTVFNSKTIGGVVTLSNGINTLTNTGTIGGAVIGGSGVDTVTNKVGLVSGEIAGIVSLGDGSDIFNGGNKAETVQDGNGADTVNFFGGNDTYIGTGHSGTDSNDTIDAGGGVDTYDASAAGSAVQINLDSIDHDISVLPLFAGGFVTAATARGRRQFC